MWRVPKSGDPDQTLRRRRGGLSGSTRFAKCPKVPFRMTLAIYIRFQNIHWRTLLIKHTCTNKCNIPKCTSFWGFFSTMFIHLCTMCSYVYIMRSRCLYLLCFVFVLCYIIFHVIYVLFIFGGNKDINQPYFGLLVVNLIKFIEIKWLKVDLCHGHVVAFFLSGYQTNIIPFI